MKANKKNQYTIRSKMQPIMLKRQPIMLKIKQVKAKESQKLVRLDLIVDYRLTFRDHVDMLCSTVNYELHAL